MLERIGETEDKSATGMVGRFYFVEGVIDIPLFIGLVEVDDFGTFEIEEEIFGEIFGKADIGADIFVLESEGRLSRADIGEEEREVERRREVEEGLGAEVEVEVEARLIGIELIVVDIEAAPNVERDEREGGGESESSGEGLLTLGVEPRVERIDVGRIGNSDKNFLGNVAFGGIANGKGGAERGEREVVGESDAVENFGFEVGVAEEEIGLRLADGESGAEFSKVGALD